MRTIWAPYKLPELKNRRGLFNVETKLAEKLLSEGVIQDPNVGAHKMTAITDEEPKRVAPVTASKKKKATKETKETTESKQTKFYDEDDIDVVTD